MISSTDFNNLNDIVAYFNQVPFDVTRKGLYAAKDL